MRTRKGMILQLNLVVEKVRRVVSLLSMFGAGKEDTIVFVAFRSILLVFY